MRGKGAGAGWKKKKKKEVLTVGGHNSELRRRSTKKDTMVKEPGELDSAVCRSSLQQIVDVA
jgi:hypothetical protein